MLEEEAPAKADLSVVFEDVVADSAVPGCDKKGGIIVVGIPQNLGYGIEGLFFVERSHFLDLAGAAAVAVCAVHTTTTIGIHVQVRQIVIYYKAH